MLFHFIFFNPNQVFLDVGMKKSSKSKMSPGVRRGREKGEGRMERRGRREREADNKDKNRNKYYN